MKKSSRARRRSALQTASAAADLMEALRRNAAALALFERLPPSHQREYIEWINEAKKEVTRRTRIQRTIEMLLDQK